LTRDLVNWVIHFLDETLLWLRWRTRAAWPLPMPTPNAPAWARRGVAQVPGEPPRSRSLVGSVAPGWR